MNTAESNEIICQASPAWRTTDGPVPQVGNLFGYGQSRCTFKVTKVDIKEVITSEGATILYGATIDLTEKVARFSGG